MRRNINSIKLSENKYLLGDLMKLLLGEMHAGLKEYSETLGRLVLTVRDPDLRGGKEISRKAHKK
jgi:hypothetical protein